MATTCAPRHLLDSKPSTRLRYCTIRLVHQEAGMEIAGSGVRETDGYFAVLYNLDGAQHGRRFQTEDEARVYFDKMD